MFDLKTRILIVDDAMTMRKMVGKMCKDLGYTDLTEAADGLLAWEAITSTPIPFGLVISDWNMPNCTGIELLKKVREDSKFSKLPFLMVTAEAEQHQIAEAIKIGVDNYLIKPFAQIDLVKKMEAIHKKRGA